MTHAEAPLDAAPVEVRARFFFLDGLRGLAALAVAWLHAFHILAGRHPVWMQNIPMAVDFFFCLSGFVVAHAYDAHLHSSLTMDAFLRKRLRRLYPMIAAGVLLGGAAALLTGAHRGTEVLAEVVTGLLVLPQGLALGGQLYPADPPMWSLFFEIAACVGYAVIVKTTPSRWLPRIVGGLGLLLGAAVLYRGNVTGFGASRGHDFLIGSLRVAYPFLLGVLIHRLDLRRRLPALPSGIGLALIGGVLLMPLGASGAFQAAAVILILPAIVLVGAATSPRMERVWDTLGRLSYPLYLVHWPVLVVTEHLLGARLPFPALAAVGLTASCAAAWAVLRLYDEPVRSFRPAAAVA